MQLKKITSIVAENNFLKLDLVNDLVWLMGSMVYILFSLLRLESYPWPDTKIKAILWEHGEIVMIFSG